MARESRRILIRTDSCRVPRLIVGVSLNYRTFDSPMEKDTTHDLMRMCAPSDSELGFSRNYEAEFLPNYPRIILDPSLAVVSLSVDGGGKLPPAFMELPASAGGCSIIAGHWSGMDSDSSAVVLGGLVF